MFFYDDLLALSALLREVSVRFDDDCGHMVGANLARRHKILATDVELSPYENLQTT